MRVPGLRIATADGPGQLWTTGVRVHVYSEPHGIDAIYFVMRRTFVNSRDGTETYLHVIPDGTWLLKLPFIKAKRRSDYRRKRGSYVESK